MVRRLPLPLLATLGLLLAACSQPQAPLASLKVLEVSPADHATSVPVDTKVTVTFDADVDGASLAGSLALVASSGSGAVAGTVTADGSSLVFTPTEVLASDTTYVATLEDSVSGIGRAALGETRSWTFTTASAANPPAGGDDDPAVPDAGGSDPGPADPDPAAPDSDGDGLPDAIDPDPTNPDTDGDGIEDGDDVDPTQPDADDDGVVDGEDEDLGIAALATVSPRPGEHVGQDVVITLTFDVPLDPASIASDAIRVYTLPNGNGIINGSKLDPEPIAGSLAYDEATNTLTFTPDAPLEHAPPFYWLFVSLDAADLDGDPVSVHAHWRFRVD